MWKSFENVGFQTSENVSWEKKETCAKHKIDRSQNGRSKNQTPIYIAPHIASESEALGLELELDRIGYVKQFSL